MNTDRYSDREELLNFIYKNAEMGEESIGYLLERVTDTRMRQHLKTQQKEYRSIMHEAHDQFPGEMQTVGPVAKMSAKMMVDMKMMNDNTPSHVAQMMIKGSTNGVIEITKKLKLYEGVGQNAERLGQKLLDTEEHNIEKLKAFLG
ncbi:MAG: hypothetical protein ACOYJY_05360 [Acutalibacteraceae bacterium]|jgi:hypothetical protein